MKRTSSSRLLRASDRLYYRLMYAYPRGFRQEYGREMEQVFHACSREAYALQGPWGVIRLWRLTLGDLVSTALNVRMEVSWIPSLSPQELRKHVTILGWIYLLLHALFLLIGGSVYVYTETGGTAGASTAEAAAMLGLLTLLALPGLFAGDGLLKGRNWGRVLALVVGIIAFGAFPIGTVISLYTFWVILQEPATDYFTA